MTVLTKRFQSEYGFETTGFVVQNGLLRIANLESTQAVFGGSNNSITIVDGVVNIKSKTGSSGLINNMVIGSITPAAGIFSTLSATTAVSLSPSGAVIINPTSVGSINNVNIGETIAGTANFTTLSSDIAQFDSSNITSALITTLTGTNLTYTTANATTINSDAVNVSATLTANDINITNGINSDNITATLITTDDIIINNEPTSSNQGTRKSYVDRTAIAFAVALGG